MDTNYVNELVAYLEGSIQRRKKALDDDLQANVMIENVVISDRLAMVQGMQRHLNKARMAKMVYETQIVDDFNAHGTTTRAALHKKT